MFLKKIITAINSCRLLKIRPNIRLLGFVAVLAVTITAGIVLVHVRRPSIASFFERIVPYAAPSAGQQKSGFLLQINRDELLLSIPNCDMKPLQGHFFVHVYPATLLGGAATHYINFDFDPTKGSSKTIVTRSSKVCIISRSFASSRPMEVVVGQFAMPNGQCCKVLWSRDYILANK